MCDHSQSSMTTTEAFLLLPLLSSRLSSLCMTTAARGTRPSAGHAPTSAQDYVHRVGRAGRRGRPGAALTLYTSDDAPRLRAVAKAARRAGCADVPSFLAADVPRRAWDAAAGEGREGSRRKRRKGSDK